MGMVMLERKKLLDLGRGHEDDGVSGESCPWEVTAYREEMDPIGDFLKDACVERRRPSTL
jgi:hypothetical protein